MNQSKSLNVEIIEGDIAIITMDVIGEKQNTLRAEFASEFHHVLDDIESKSLTGVIITSGKKNSFIVGADINMLSSLKTKEQVLEVSKAGYEIFDRLENFDIPIVAEIHGACMGGGLELTLACHGRICSDHASTLLALPEVQLGLLPGAGGTQRLPALIGVAEALGMITTGRNIRPAKAVKIGLVDGKADVYNLRQASIKRVKSLTKEHLIRMDEEPKFQFKRLLSIKGWQDLALEKTQPGLNFLFEQARKKVFSKTRGNYPAPEKIIDCVEAWASGNRSLGYEMEAKSFSELVVSPEARQLIQLFFAVTELKKHSYVSDGIEPKKITNLGVVGGGLMGAGIAMVSVDKAHSSVRIKDIEEEGINNSLKYTWDKLQTKVKKRHLTQQQAASKMSLLSGGTDYTGFAQADLIIEAVFESLELKQQILKDVEKNCSKEIVFATNTSSIPITEIAATAKRPENVIGMHYFSPVEKMPLLELVITEKTSEQTIATSVDFGRKQGKTVIVVKDGAGFYTSRILIPYTNEAGHLLTEGVSIESIDQALVNAGYPVGPITLTDEVGIDVGTKIIQILQDSFGERMTPAGAFTKLVGSGRLGRKNKKGFYDYTSTKKGKRSVDSTVYDDLGIKPDNKVSASIIAERCNLMLMNEAIRCLGEGILDSARDGDIGAIFGLGFPAFLGGPFRYADSLGLDKLIEQLQSYEKQLGPRFKPCAHLLELASNNQKFY